MSDIFEPMKKVTFYKCSYKDVSLPYTLTNFEI